MPRKNSRIVDDQYHLEPQAKAVVDDTGGATCATMEPGIQLSRRPSSLPPDRSKRDNQAEAVGAGAGSARAIMTPVRALRSPRRRNSQNVDDHGAGDHLRAAVIDETGGTTADGVTSSKGLSRRPSSSSPRRSRSGSDALVSIAAASDGGGADQSAAETLMIPVRAAAESSRSDLSSFDVRESNVGEDGAGSATISVATDKEMRSPRRTKTKPATADGRYGYDTPRSVAAGASASSPDDAGLNIAAAASGHIYGAGVIGQLIAQHRQRVDLHRAEKSLTLQMRAKCRRLAKGGDKDEADLIYDAMFGKDDHPNAAVALTACAPFIQARSYLETTRRDVEKTMEKLAKALPVASFVEETAGFGYGSLAAIVGEAGEGRQGNGISDYPRVSCLWKRFGLAVMPDGTRQRKVTGVDALEHGYVPERRSIAWNIGQSVFKAQSARIDKDTGEVKRAAGYYRQVYDARKAYEIERDPEVRPVVAHCRAVRYMEKRLILKFWKAWRVAMRIEGAEEETVVAEAAE